MKNIIDDEELTRAAKLVGKAIRESLPDPDTCAHEPSLKFKNTIKRLEKRTRRKNKIVKYIKKGITAAVIALCCTGMWIASNPEARAFVSSWVHGIYENTIVFLFHGNSEPTSLPEYEVNYLPTGYYEIPSNIEMTSMKSKRYSNGEEVIYIDCMILAPGSPLQVFSTDIEIRETTVNESYAEFIIPQDKTQTIDLLWADEERNVRFIISAFLDMDEIIKIAESITYIE